MLKEKSSLGRDECVWGPHLCRLDGAQVIKVTLVQLREQRGV